MDRDPDAAVSLADYASPKGPHRRTGGTIDVARLDNRQPYIRSLATPDAVYAF
jgi:hypothetical protein